MKGGVRRGFFSGRARRRGGGYGEACSPTVARGGEEVVTLLRCRARRRGVRQSCERRGGDNGEENQSQPPFKGWGQTPEI